MRMRPWTTVQRTILMLGALLLMTEGTLVVLFHLYVLEPAATRFAEILIDANRSTNSTELLQNSRHLEVRPASSNPGHRPRNDFLGHTRSRIVAMTSGGDMRISRSNSSGQGIIWIRTSRAASWTGFPLSRLDFGGSNFVLLRLMVLGAFTFLGTIVIVRQINRPLSRLAALADEWGKGDSIFNMESFGGPDEVRKVEQAIRSMAQNLRNLYEERAILLTGISHEMRTPLSRLLLTLHLPDEKLLAQRQAMQDDVSEMNDTLSQFLTLVRSDRQERSILGDLSPFLERMAGIGRERYNLQIEWPLQELPSIFYKPLALERLVRNLFDNASRYGAELVRISLSETAREIVMQFWDNGPGFAKPAERNAAPSTYRVSSTGGSGLGILICQRIAHLHGGTIQFWNHPEGGLVAELHLPRQHNMSSPDRSHF